MMQREVLAVIISIAEMFEPVAQNNYFGAIVKFAVNHDVSVTENKIIDMFMRVLCLPFAGIFSKRVGRYVKGRQGFLVTSAVA